MGDRDDGFALDKTSFNQLFFRHDYSFLLFLSCHGNISGLNQYLVVGIVGNFLTGQGDSQV